MQALTNYEKEIKTAFDKMRADLGRHKDVFKRLEDDLATVKLFEQADHEEALADMRKQDSALYAVILDAYEREGQDSYCQGMVAAVNAIYNLGYMNGCKDGMKKGTGKNE